MCTMSNKQKCEHIFGIVRWSMDMEWSVCPLGEVLLSKKGLLVIQGATNNERSISNSTPGPTRVPGPTTHASLHSCIIKHPNMLNTFTNSAVMVGAV